MLVFPELFPVLFVFAGIKEHVALVQGLTAEKAPYKMDFLQRLFLAGCLVQAQKPHGAAAVFHDDEDLLGKIKVVLDKGGPGEKIIGDNPLPAGLPVIFQNKQAPVSFFLFFFRIIDGRGADGNQLHIAVCHDIPNIHHGHCRYAPLFRFKVSCILIDKVDKKIFLFRCQRKLRPTAALFCVQTGCCILIIS